jgi:hypothetical protein
MAIKPQARRQFGAAGRRRLTRAPIIAGISNRRKDGPRPPALQARIRTYQNDARPENAANAAPGITCAPALGTLGGDHGQAYTEHDFHRVRLEKLIETYSFQHQSWHRQPHAGVAQTS